MRVHIEANVLGILLRKPGTELQELSFAISALLNRMQTSRDELPGVHQIIGSDGRSVIGMATFHAGRNGRPIMSMVHTKDIEKAIAILEESVTEAKRSPASAPLANKIAEAAKVLRNSIS